MQHRKHQKKGEVVNVVGWFSIFSLAPRELAFTAKGSASSKLTRLLSSHCDGDGGRALSSLRLRSHPDEVESVGVQVCQSVGLSHWNVTVVPFLHKKTVTKQETLNQGFYYFVVSVIPV